MIVNDIEKYSKKILKNKNKKNDELDELEWEIYIKMMEIRSSIFYSCHRIIKRLSLISSVFIYLIKKNTIYINKNI